ncbi:flp pilus-assembly TadE/G-like family protein [Paenarthrobacter sp. Z7-10]|uniref:Rv3654c family TadE-like protein n=1 Tax=Paenarthrobacter sp. Z7-10 TaxID=2787635 RepID=UPI0022A8E72C|nr:Rv3654c family TadE-like protein [Paenarthrobacter sp. Z7-10]MCZ2401796.1 flp pilus-assembly TadE/G-like family protein [Paenarthrobacter sp. Z7-10]
MSKYPDREAGAPKPTAGRERGSGTVLAVGVICVLLSMLAALLLITQAAVAASRAATAADLAALAGADAARDLISGEPCTVAASVVAQHRAALVSCIVGGHERDIVDISTRVDLPPPWGAAKGHARAGPPPMDDSPRGVDPAP